MAPHTPEDVRRAAAALAGRALHARIRDEGVELLAGVLQATPPEVESEAAAADPARRPLADDEATASFVLALDAINFGSGWFPVLAKRDGLSGYHHIATCLRERWERDPLTAEQLVQLDAPAVATLLEQPNLNAAGDLFELYASALADLGRLLLDRHGGRASALIESANGSAVELVRLLQAMPMFRDAAYHGGEVVPFLKRAQLAAADLHVAFGGQGLGRFGDLDRLTMFADNLVPHVLRVDGVLAYDGHLTEMLDNSVPLAPDSVEEVEVRAVAVHAVEALAAALGRPAHEVDHLLWTRGQGFAYRDGVSRRHRTRTWAY